jgi:ABC-2 type transport system ATP-binding protein
VSAIVVDRLTKHFGDFAALDDVSFEIPEGQLVAVLGPNGAGKSTTLEILEGFLTPTSGTVRVLGADPHRGNRRWRARIGLVLQSTSLDAELTVRETLTVFAGLYPAPRRVGEVLELVDLVDDAEARVGSLSGGQRRRVDVAIGIIGRPEVLFLDEPTTGLDPEARRRAWTAVQNLTTTGTTVVLTTHYIDEAEFLAHRLILLAAGRMVADTTPNGLRARGGPDTIRCRVDDEAPLADLPAALEGQFERDGAELVFRAEDVTASLRDLLGWADRHHLDLADLEVGPPSLEDAYLATIGQSHPRQGALS